LSGRNWHGAYMALLAILFAAQAWSDSSAQVISNSFPSFWRGIWFGGLIVFAAWVLFGALWHSLFGLLVERAGLVALSFLCVSYGLAFAAAAGHVGAEVWHLVYAVGMVLVFAIVNTLRAFQITREITATRDGLKRIADVREVLK